MFARTVPLTRSMPFPAEETVVLNSRIMLSQVLPSANVGWLVKFLKNERGYISSSVEEKVVLRDSRPSRLEALKWVVPGFFELGTSRYASHPGSKEAENVLVP